ncbi:hypothetical protein Pcinc_043314 [Petrolisthes cinctipes]|uniref:Uncharacterized protein n=1 Tax=Petrolisthes cinctipes TaxID=88211 RepID=A0AAE1BHV5_PETCI|nr:hypothetical protein Pcinc_043314 [Petrolisthes cinctipes]
MKNLLIVGVVLGFMSVVVEGREKEDGRIIAAYSTRTAFVISSTTTTVFFTCERLNNGDACQRRRFKRYSIMDFSDHDRHSRPFGTRELDPSEGDFLTPSPINEEVNNREGRLVALTIWTTTSSTFTITATSTDNATTFSLSFFCTIHDDDNHNNNGKNRLGKFVARFVETTVTSLTTSTTVVPLTCVSFGASTNTCGRRRRYRSYSMVKFDDDKDATGHTQLDGSVLENGNEEFLDLLEPTLKSGSGGEKMEEEEDEGEADGVGVVGEGKRREGRIAISIVSTTTTTFTLTSTSINDQTTFSISFFCSAPGPPAPPAC